jgi:hypothetical protein
MPAWGAGAFAPPYQPYAPQGPSAEEEIEMLKEQSGILSEQIEQINKRIAELQEEAEKAEQ